MAEPRVCLGVITSAHGVRGLVRIKPFTATPEDVAAYGPLSDEAGTRQFVLAVTGRAKNAVLARIEGVTDRDQAQDLAGMARQVLRVVVVEVAQASRLNAFRGPGQQLVFRQVQAVRMAKTSKTAVEENVDKILLLKANIEVLPMKKD